MKIRIKTNKNNQDTSYKLTPSSFHTYFSWLIVNSIDVVSVTLKFKVKDPIDMRLKNGYMPIPGPSTPGQSLLRRPMPPNCWTNTF